MKRFLTDLRASFWFIPALLVVLAAALAVLTIELDAIVGEQALSRFPRLFGAGAEGSREMLAAIASSTITVAGVVFSITIVALSMTAAQYSPRVLRNFMRDRANQVVLGIFVGIYTYCMIVLRSVRGGEDSFVPGISVVVAIAFAFVGIGFLIFFIHHIATSIQVSSITARIAHDTMNAIDKSFPVPLEQRRRADYASDLEQQSWHPVAAGATGYIQNVDIEALVGYAHKHGRTLRMERAVGEFVIEGQELLSISGAERPDRAATAAVNEKYSINMFRDIDQDPAFGIQQLVDIALKALSPGVNDTGTARNSVNYLTAVLSVLSTRCIEEDPHETRDDRVLLIKKNRSFEIFIDTAFDPVRRSSTFNADMTLHLLHVLAQLASAAGSDQRHQIIRRQIVAIQQNLDKGDLAAKDRTALADCVRSALGTRRGSMRVPMR